MKRLTLGVVVVAALAIGSSVRADVVWHGLTFDISGGTAAIDGSGNLVLTQGSSEVDAHVSLASTTINSGGTPWIKFSYLDPGPSNSKKIDGFIDGQTNVLDPRLQAGSLFSFQGLGYERYGAAAIENVDFAVGSGARVAGDAHTIYAGKQSDGTVDYAFDGTAYVGTFLKNTPGIGGAWSFDTLYLRGRGGVQGDTFTFTDLSYGSNNASAFADAVSAPLPSSASAGLGLLAIVGTWQAWRRAKAWLSRPC